MKLRITTRHLGESLGALRVCGRIEIQWSDPGRWFNLGTNVYDDLEWYLLISLLVMGARNSGVAVEHVEIKLPEVKVDCATL